MLLGLAAGPLLEATERLAGARRGALSALPGVLPLVGFATLAIVGLASLAESGRRRRSALFKVTVLADVLLTAATIVIMLSVG